MLSALSLTACVIAADQITKYLIRAGLASYEAVVLTPFLNIVHVENRGAAFGMFAGLGNAFFIGITAVAIAVILWLIVRGGKGRLPLALLLGGAVGNLIDRIVFGTVTDFVDVHVAGRHWPAFNVADSALTVGIILLMVTEILQRPAGREPNP